MERGQKQKKGQRSASSAFVSVHGFVGFGDETAASSTFDDQLDPEVQLILTKLAKRDLTTKVKGLSELKATFQAYSAAQKPVDAILPYWVQHFTRLVLCNDASVRTATYLCLRTSIQTAGRAFAPHLKSVLGWWWVSMYEPCPEVAATAQEAMQTLFPGPKQVELLKNLHAVIVNHITDVLHSPPSSLDDASDTKAESAERWARVATGCLAALAQLAGRLAPDHLPALVEAQVDDALLLLAKHKAPAVRAAAMSFVGALSRVIAAELLSTPERGRIVVEMMEIGLNDADPHTHSALWEMLLLVLRNCAALWQAPLYPDRTAGLLPRLVNFYRKQAATSPGSSYPSALPLVSLVPLEVAGPAFRPDLLKAIWAGTTSHLPGSSETATALQAYAEVLAYCAEHGPARVTMCAITATIMHGQRRAVIATMRAHCCGHSHHHA
ncbi:putative ubiquitin-protein ligase RKR1 [Paratrimastix pyriformis]|uniref:E3 ubiquitin-protein ligase listerin n=1 Tax=Paratrimastix pyriformis TaxID=342808 RepID=A0ABQ8UT10_9EUKA|nr:putative ubiquitin-protein ligase RKR1 [Paratrimastix pyriformis]